MTLPLEVGEALALAGDRVTRFVADLRWHAEVPSTNDVAARLAEQGAAEGTVVAAEAQTAGRGRHGRTWASPPGAGLYVSVILRPPASALPLVTIAAGVALAEGIAAATGLRPRLKWPNDLYVGERKLAGILTESSWLPAPAGRPHVVLGFGINVLAAAYPPDIAARATSLESEIGRGVNAGLLLAECLAALGDRYRDLVEGREAAVLEAWRRYAEGTLGRRVEWDDQGRRRTGVAHDIDAGGALLVRVGQELVRVIAGEVRWIP